MHCDHRVEIDFITLEPSVSIDDIPFVVASFVFPFKKKFEQCLIYKKIKLPTDNPQMPSCMPFVQQVLSYPKIKIQALVFIAHTHYDSQRHQQLTSLMTNVVGIFH